MRTFGDERVRRAGLADTYFAVRTQLRRHSRQAAPTVPISTVSQATTDAPAPAASRSSSRAMAATDVCACRNGRKLAQPLRSPRQR
jgi:hypothetical protein